jgi:hypothetical protein
MPFFKKFATFLPPAQYFAGVIYGVALLNILIILTPVAVFTTDAKPKAFCCPDVWGLVNTYSFQMFVQ